MNKNQIDLREIVSLSVKYLTLVGYYCPDTRKTLSNFFYYAYAIFSVVFFLAVLILSETISMIVVFGDIEKMTEASFLFLTHCVQSVKLYCFVSRKSKVIKFVNSLNREEFKPRNEEQLEILKNDIELATLIAKVFMVMGIGTCMLWATFPLLDKEDEPMQLPLSGWFPFDTTKSPTFEIAYVYQSVGALFGAIGNVGMDSFIAGVNIALSGQLKILNDSFLRLNNINNKNCANRELIRNIIHHENIIEYANDLVTIFSLCIVGQFVVGVVIICMTMFQISLVPIASYQFVSMALYQSCMLFEIFLLCYFGNDAILESENLTLSAYMCGWVDCSKEFKQNLLYFMTRSQIPVKLYAGGYFPLSIDTLKAIVKSSWSYYAVLNSVHEEF